MIDVAEGSVEPAHGAEARGEGDLRHGQSGFVDELFSEVQAARLRHCAGRGSQVTQKETPKMARPNAKVSARASTPPSSRPVSLINRKARETVFCVPAHAGVPGEDSGRQRKHGRKPASAAAAALGKYRMFFSCEVRPRQTGRQ